MIKPYLNVNNDEDNDEQELPYILVMYHRLHHRFPKPDCKYEQDEGCLGCDLKEYIS